MRRKKVIRDLVAEIVSTVDHGECFYEYDDLEDLLAALDKLKEVSIEEYNSNQEE